MQGRFWKTALPGPAGTPPTRRDWILAGVLFVGAVIQTALLEVTQAGAEILVTALVCAAFPYRRLRPVVVIVWSLGVMAISFALGRVVETSNEVTLAAGIATLAAIYSLFRWGTKRQIVVGAVAATALVVAGERAVANGSGVLEAMLFEIPWPLIGAVALAIRYRASFVESRLAEARLVERNAIARDLHDAVAHQVAVISVQAQAAKFVAKSNPDALIQAVDQIAETANEAMEEIRRLVVVLRGGSEDVPARTSFDLKELARSTGPTRVTVAGDTDMKAVPIATAVAIYRIAQEGTTNAIRHNENLTFVHIELRLCDSTANLRITNDGKPTTKNRGSGLGIVGMNERVAALGGRIESQRRERSGWHLDAIIPLPSQR